MAVTLCRLMVGCPSSSRKLSSFCVAKRSCWVWPHLWAQVIGYTNNPLVFQALPRLLLWWYVTSLDLSCNSKLEGAMGRRERRRGGIGEVSHLFPCLCVINLSHSHVFGGTSWHGVWLDVPGWPATLPSNWCFRRKKGICNWYAHRRDAFLALLCSWPWGRWSFPS